VANPEREREEREEKRDGRTKGEKAAPASGGEADALETEGAGGCAKSAKRRRVQEEEGAEKRLRRA